MALRQYLASNRLVNSGTGLNKLNNSSRHLGHKPFNRNNLLDNLGKLQQFMRMLQRDGRNQLVLLGLRQ
jgi:hypothetical protein